MKKSFCRRDVKKFSFPYKSIVVRNGLKEEAVCVKTIHELIAKLALECYGDGTGQA